MRKLKGPDSASTKEELGGVSLASVPEESSNTEIQLADVDAVRTVERINPLCLDSPCFTQTNSQYNFNFLLLL